MKEYFSGERLHEESRLTFSEEVDKLGKYRRAVFDCDCGESVVKYIHSVKCGEVKSCGCLLREVASNTHKKYKNPSSDLYNTWFLMNNRCSNKNADDYLYYGGRGISVCYRWNIENDSGFDNFYEDMGNRPSNLTLDRIDNDGDYSPSNCKWETASNQRFNRRKFKNNTSGVTGVSFHKTKNKWVVTISKDGETISLGNYTDFEDAVDARKQAEEKYYG